MSNNERILQITVNTSAPGDYVIKYDGQYELSLDGVFDSASVAYHAFSDEFGRGASIRTAATAAESFGTVSRTIELVVTGGGGSLALDVVTRPLLGNGVQGA